MSKYNKDLQPKKRYVTLKFSLNLFIDSGELRKIISEEEEDSEFDIVVFSIKVRHYGSGRVFEVGSIEELFEGEGEELLEY
jgi:hypothetical protein